MKSPQDLADYLQSRSIEAEIIALPGDTRTVDQAAAALGVPADRIVKSLLFLAAGQPVLAVACGLERIDTRRLAGNLGISKRNISLAGSEQVRSLTGYEVGSVPPVGHAPEIRVLVDPAVLEFETVYAGGGAPDRMLRLSPQAILLESGAQVADLQAPRG